MTQDQIKSKVTEIIRDVLDDETIILTRETTANDVEDWDSLAHISIIVAIEKEFYIKFDLTELKPIQNVGQLLDMINRKIVVAGNSLGGNLESLQAPQIMDMINEDSR
jgi:acyl carrier protein